MSRRAWARCPVCGAQVDDLAEHQQRHANVDQRAQDAWTEACAAKEIGQDARAKALELRAALEQMQATAAELQTRLTEMQTTLANQRADIAELKARNPAQPPAKGQNSGG